MVTKSPATCHNYSTSSSLNIGILNLASLIQHCNSRAIVFFGRGDQKITTSLVRDYYRFYPVTSVLPLTQPKPMAMQHWGCKIWLTSLNMQNITHFTAFLFIKWFTFNSLSWVYQHTTAGEDFWILTFQPAHSRFVLRTSTLGV